MKNSTYNFKASNKALRRWKIDVASYVAKTILLDLITHTLSRHRFLITSSICPASIQLRLGNLHFNKSVT